MSYLVLKSSTSRTAAPEKTNQEQRMPAAPRVSRQTGPSPTMPKGSQGQQPASPAPTGNQARNTENQYYSQHKSSARLAKSKDRTTAKTTLQLP